MDPWKYQPAADQGLEPHARWQSLKREPGLGQLCTQALWRGVAGSYLRIYHRFTVTGTEHIPTHAPFVMVGNHTSHLDALALATALPWHLRRTAFPIAAGDVFFEKPAVAAFAAMMLNALPMWRKRAGMHAMHDLRERLIGEPAIFILFPEGTRSRTGQLGRFKPGVGMLVAGTDVPVLPCYLSGAGNAFPPGSKLPRPGRLHLKIGRPQVFADLENERTGWQEIAARLEKMVSELAPT